MSKDNNHNVIEISLSTLKNESIEHHENGNGNNGNILSDSHNSTGVNNIEVIRPSIQCHTHYFTLNDKRFKPGLYNHALKDDEEIDMWLANPILVMAITSDCAGKEFGRLLHFQDVNGLWHYWAMPMRILKSNGDDVIAVLLDQGFVFQRSKRSLLIDYLMMSHPEKRLTATTQIGWLDNCFVLPSKTIGSKEIVFQSDSSINDEYQIKGSIESWKENIGRYCVGNKLLITAISAALSGVLLNILNRTQGGGIHIVGDSSSGKSTNIEVAASVWGPPSFVRSWSTTANGFEGVAASRNDTSLILDEIDEALPHEISRILYMLANGQGKQRANKNADAKQIRRWRTTTLSTGERTLNEIMAQANRSPNSGQIVRLINIKANYQYGAFEELHGFSSGREFADYLKEARTKDYGIVGPLFVEHLICDNNTEINSFMEDICSSFKPLSTNKLESRAAATFEIIALAGELGIKYGLLPWQSGSVVIALVELFERWTKNEDGGKTEDERIIEYVCTFINKFSDSRFTDHDSLDQRTLLVDRAGWYKNTPGGKIYMFFTYALKEAGNGYSATRIAEALQRNGYLVDSDKDRLSKKTRLGDGTSENLFYVRILHRDGDVI